MKTFAPPRNLSSRPYRRGVALVLAAGLSGCATVRLNHAMERLHTGYDELFVAVRSEDSTRIYFSAQTLSTVFDDPAISGYSSDARFQGHLEGSQRILHELTTGVGSLGPRESRRLRKRLFENCQACHRDYRR